MENLFTMPKKLIALGALLFLFACSSDEMNTNDLQSNATALLSGKANTDKLLVFKGPEVQFGHGKVRSWISVTKDGAPMEIGFELTPELLMHLEDLDHHNGEEPASDKHASVTVPLHLKARQLTPFDHLEMNWNPEGHPDPFFFKPHFDFHFYMISLAEQMAIPEWSEETNAMFNNLPATCFQPPGYGIVPGEAASIAQMGKHWLPFYQLGNPDFSFSKVLIYGSYDRKFNFIEPMITVDYLLSNEDFSGNYNQPMKFQKAGNYPTKYNITHDENGNIKITLSDFIYREKSETCD